MVAVGQRDAVGRGRGPRAWSWPGWTWVFTGVADGQLQVGQPLRNESDDLLLPGGELVERRSAQLTAREKEIVGLVAEGLSNSDIAAALTISHATVKTHVSRAMTKLEARDRAQLVALAYRHHLVEPPGRADRV